MNDVIIIHFRPVAIYPPVINLIRFLSEHKELKVTLCTTEAKSAPIFNGNVKVIVPKDVGRFLRRLFAIRFYFLAFVKMLSNKDASVIYYESLSSVPVWFYLSLFRNSKRKMMAHFHEYFSEEEYQKQSFLERLGRKSEKNIFTKLSWISHTNNDRLNMFEEEFPGIKKEDVHVLPNFPPTSWLIDSNKRTNRIGLLSLIYVGSLSFENIYTRELVEWVVSKKGMITCDFYSLNATAEIANFINNQPGDVVKFKGAIPYEDLPSVLRSYDVGLIMYKGISRNVIFSAPNKMFEYLACGLDVWCSIELISSRPYAHAETYPKVMMVDFSNLKSFDWETAFDHTNLTYRASPYVMEEVYEKLYQKIIGK